MVSFSPRVAVRPRQPARVNALIAVLSDCEQAAVSIRRAACSSSDQVNAAAKKTATILFQSVFRVASCFVEHAIA
jgi:hypothetical protein